MPPSYKPSFTIDNLASSVNALAFSPDGKYIACSLEDARVTVHDIRKTKSEPVCTYQGHAEVTALVWLDTNFLVMGNMDGEILTLKIKFLGRTSSKLVYEGFSAVNAIEMKDAHHVVLVCLTSAVCAVEISHTNVWNLHRRLDGPKQFDETDGFDTPPVIATGAHFLNKDHDILVSYLHHGLWIYDLRTGDSVWMYGPGEKIGPSAVSPDRKCLVSANMRSGLDWYVLPECTKVSMSSERMDRAGNIPLPVIFIDNGRAVLLGTTKGYAVIFHTEHGGRLQTLEHGHGKTWITAIAHVRREDGLQLIATGDGNLGEDTRVRVWFDSRHVKSGFSWPVNTNWACYLLCALLLSLTLYTLNTLVPLGSAIVKHIPHKIKAGTQYILNGSLGVLRVVHILPPAPTFWQRVRANVTTSYFVVPQIGWMAACVWLSETLREGLVRSFVLGGGWMYRGAMGVWQSISNYISGSILS